MVERALLAQEPLPRAVARDLLGERSSGKGSTSSPNTEVKAPMSSSLRLSISMSGAASMRFITRERTDETPFAPSLSGDAVR